MEDYSEQSKVESLLNDRIEQSKVDSLLNDHIEQSKVEPLLNDRIEQLQYRIQKLSNHSGQLNDCLDKLERQVRRHEKLESEIPLRISQVISHQLEQRWDRIQKLELLQRRRDVCEFVKQSVRDMLEIYRMGGNLNIYFQNRLEQLRTGQIPIADLMMARMIGYYKTAPLSMTHLQSKYAPCTLVKCVWVVTADGSVVLEDVDTTLPPGHSIWPIAVERYTDTLRQFVKPIYG